MRTQILAFTIAAVAGVFSVGAHASIDRQIFCNLVQTDHSAVINERVVSDLMARNESWGPGRVSVRLDIDEQSISTPASAAKVWSSKPDKNLLGRILMANAFVEASTQKYFFLSTECKSPINPASVLADVLELLQDRGFETMCSLNGGAILAGTLAQTELRKAKTGVVSADCFYARK